MTLSRMAQPFSHPEWLYEIKADGFRALAHLNRRQCKLVSRKDHVYKRFHELSEEISNTLNVKSAILDGELCCLDSDGRSQFYNLMFRRGPVRFYAFDLVELNGKDLRSLSLLKRKQILKRLIPARSPAVLYADHVTERGEELFKLACARDLEGIVAKWMHGPYDRQRISSWIKIKNPSYSQIVGREKLFEKKSEPQQQYERIKKYSQEPEQRA